MSLDESALFFIVLPLNLEDLGLIELEDKFKLHFPEDTCEIKEKSSGGILIECPLMAGLCLNVILRTPTRILLRLGEFKCRDAPKLYQKMSKFNWAPWMIGQTPIVESASTNSRLFDSRKIEKAIQDGVNQYYRHKPVKKKYLEHFEKNQKASLPKIYFRAVDDVCTISLDTTGERLHLRGEKIMTGLAPIRESLAALLLIELGRHLKEHENYTLIDPMCGSGTFLLEANDAHKITTERDFSYLHFPLVLDNLNKLPKFNSGTNSRFSKFIGFDQSSEVVSLAKKNTKETHIQIKEADIFKNETLQFENAVVIMNPPYGIRVGEKSEINLAYYLEIIEQAQKKFNPEFLGIIVPADYKLAGKQNFKILSMRPFKNGGIEVVFYVLRSNK